MAAPPASLDRSRPACETDRGWKGSRWRRPAQLATQREDTPTGHERDWDYCRRRRTRRTQDEKLARTAVASERDGCWQRYEAASQPASQPASPAARQEGARSHRQRRTNGCIAQLQRSAQSPGSPLTSICSAIVASPSPSPSSSPSPSPVAVGRLSGPASPVSSLLRAHPSTSFQRPAQKASLPGDPVSALCARAHLDKRETSHGSSPPRHQTGEPGPRKGPVVVGESPSRGDYLIDPTDASSGRRRRRRRRCRFRSSSWDMHATSERMGVELLFPLRWSCSSLLVGRIGMFAPSPLDGDVALFCLLWPRWRRQAMSHEP
ncbi:hypothetical protein H113_04971 [Trichophyton rubrum MR1459]|uniref:Uncharacterized protein n=2 Tax=Trichophyton TaxID=5550 RepID=A0A178F3W4_TRIRU|nr:hypothetical protein H100_04940 [Trichophyton rubrum MR850]EZF41215.1 hypothetical protein H102_04926 [Trichophyton rubrum CBS 100081]EZF62461.1 hypothetical protein H104_04921 [Trichophyton rubrum CBS 289.86]EZF73099.1 hypothetical protein H105_04946 [Trichophyton soudanense CBS 452.61]EZF83780.1 hypothetical protein H110_04927 [Trichophyton rubrum MR1448]EZF94485.1 hypothetical protein H113_04971 [Trichophyton rubrum MR1459]OAL67011.1 hypothetical protein A7C99_2410 [Trichophyton rubrum]